MNSSNSLKFSPGTLVIILSEPEQAWPVVRGTPSSPEAVYTLFYQNTLRDFYESQLAPAEDKFAQPLPLLEAADFKACMTALHLNSPSAHHLLAARSGKINFIPYQYRPVMKLLKSDRPRLLIADEVGVGKTIEAGLILKELRARHQIKRVLILCPKALIAERKWEKEMLRFGEKFIPLDGSSLRHALSSCDSEGEWPSHQANVLIPFSLFDEDLLRGVQKSKTGKRLGLWEMSDPPKFDLVIVDEAHHLRNKDTWLHQGARFFCENAAAVIFLSATPIQLGSQDLFTLLNLLRPDLVPNLENFQRINQPNRSINQAATTCRRADADWQQQALVSLDAAAATDWGSQFLRPHPQFEDIRLRLKAQLLSDAERLLILREIEELNTFSSLINRTRRRDIGSFTTRKPVAMSIDFTPAQAALHKLLLNTLSRISERLHQNINAQFLLATIRRQAASSLYALAPHLKDFLDKKVERLLEVESFDSGDEVDTAFIESIRPQILEITALAEKLPPNDPKADALFQIVAEKNLIANNKILLFSFFRHTLHYLHQLALGKNLRVGLIHGDIPDRERAELRRRFSLPRSEDEAIDLLLSSEVGCEGLDFQFCNYLVNYDIPWNPMRIEQRIGRIDRYGQESESVVIHNLITPGTIDADIYTRCLERIGIFQQTIGGTEEILGDLCREIKSISENFKLTESEIKQRLQQLADNNIGMLQESERLETQSEALIGLKLSNVEWDTMLAKATSQWLSSDALENCVKLYLSERCSERELLHPTRKTYSLRIPPQLRQVLLGDFREWLKSLPDGKARKSEPRIRSWERWLEGSPAHRTISFDSAEAATEDVDLIDTSHPLVGQACRFWSQKSQAGGLLQLQVNEPSLAKGSYPFLIQIWTYKGLHPEEHIRFISEAPAELNVALSQLLPYVSSIKADAPPTCDTLQKQQHQIWKQAREQQREKNLRLLEMRRNSLTFSHEARCRTLRDQVAQSQGRIQVMRESELKHAQIEFEGRSRELAEAASRADLHTHDLFKGVLHVNVHHSSSPTA